MNPTLVSLLLRLARTLQVNRHIAGAGVLWFKASVSRRARLAPPSSAHLYLGSPRVEAHSKDLTSRSPASKDQTSSLVSTCHTFKRPLMSPVATRVESWQKPAHVTESLWPAKRNGQILSSNLPERCSEFKASLGYIVNPRPTQTI